MTVSEWISLAANLEIEGLEWYAGFLEMEDPANWSRFRKEVEDHGMVIPMMCCSPDFTHPDPAFRENEIAKQKHWIEMTHALGGSYCRVLSGQRRPELSIEEGITFASDSIHACLPHAAERGITLIIENHYKDDFWNFPEFAQKMDTFCKLIDRIDSPHFGVNYDPSNTYLAGEDPLELLKRVSHRVVTMHASDRYLAEGTLEDLRREEGGVTIAASSVGNGVPNSPSRRASPSPAIQSTRASLTLRNVASLSSSKTTTRTTSGTFLNSLRKWTPSVS